MKSMKKDEKLQKSFSEYFDGVKPPAVDTSVAKRIISEKKKKSRLIKVLVSFGSVFACLVIMAVGIMIHINNTKMIFYEESALRVESVFYSAVKEQCGAVADPLENLEYSDNAHIDYSMYFENDSLRYIRAEITVLNAYGREDVILYAEVTDGRHTSEKFKKYYELESKGSLSGTNYIYSKEYVGGEWVASAYMLTDSVKIFIDAQSPNSKSLEKYLYLFA